MVPSDANSLGGRARWKLESLRRMGTEGAGEGNSRDLLHIVLLLLLLFLPPCPLLLLLFI